MSIDRELSKKEEVRYALTAAENFYEAAHQVAGKIAERLRGFSVYRQAKRVFISPEAALSQTRINALLDGKELFMPGPGLKEGFFSFLPYTISPDKLAYAVSYRGLVKFGKRMNMETLHGAGIDLMLTDALAIDLSGNRLGEGKGFFDLSVAILAALHALSEEVVIMAAITYRQLYQDGLLPCDPWDVRVNGAVTPTEVKMFESNRSGFPQIFWEELPRKRIKKITPLWQIYTSNP